MIEPSNLTPWSDWTSCSETCGPGTTTRTRKCEEDPNCPAENDDCDGAKLSETDDCQTECCKREFLAVNIVWYRYQCIILIKLHSVVLRS